MIIRNKLEARFFHYMRRHVSVSIIGVGSVGSNVARIAASMLANPVVLVDPDVVEPENLCISALYGESGLGRPKVEVARDAIHDMAGGCVSAYPLHEEYSSHHVNADIVVAAVDSMAVRNRIYEDWLSSDGEWLVDYRMAGKFGSVLFVKKGEDHGYYVSQSDPNDTYASLPCGQQAHPAVTCGFVPFTFGAFLAAIMAEEEWSHREIHGGAWIGMMVEDRND